MIKSLQKMWLDLPAHVPPSTPAPPCPGWGRGRTRHQVNSNTHNINIFRMHNHFLILFLAILLSTGSGLSLSWHGKGSDPKRNHCTMQRNLVNVQFFGRLHFCFQVQRLSPWASGRQENWRNRGVSHLQALTSWNPLRRIFHRCLTCKLHF